jgi:glycosyltransferase involved in cell wall biosynthesis
MNINNYSLSEMSLRTTEIKAIEEEPSGLLDGLTLFRFAHMGRFASSGGVETYLWNLNRVLLERNAMRILQMYIVQEGEPSRIEVEKVGQGELVWIPSVLRVGAEVRPGIVRRVLEKLSGGQGYECAVSHSMLLSNFVNYQPSLGVFHWISEDSRAVINYLHMRNIPFVVVHHFHNKKLNERMVSKQISKAQAIAGVSEVDLPIFLNNRFINIADGIDIDFFNLKAARPLNISIKEPIVFLPARICKEKGHLDAVRAFGLLARGGVKAVLAFAGYEENQDFTNKLRNVISEEGVQERVIFVGELLPSDLRDWYAASDVVVLPTYHSEGLPRVLLESQAMERPVLAYDSGGTREAFREGVSGFLLKKGDIRGLSNRLQDLLEDKVVRSVMGQRGREFVVDRFSLDALVIRHERFYANNLNK